MYSKVRPEPFGVPKSRIYGYGDGKAKATPICDRHRVLWHLDMVEFQDTSWIGLYRGKPVGERRISLKSETARVGIVNCHVEQGKKERRTCMMMIA